MSKKPKKPGMIVRRKAASAALATDLLGDVRTLIEAARDATARAVNSALVLLYWSIGDRIRRDVLQEKRAEYGEEIVPTLSAQLVPLYGEGYGKRNLFRMIRLAEVFPEPEIVGALSQQLGWSHFVEILPIKDQLKRAAGREISGLNAYEQ
jgi:hypothetical protein